MRVRLLPLLLGLFVLVPLLDTLVLVFIGGKLGFWATIAIVIVSGTLGAGMAKGQGLRVFREVQQDWREGRVPTQGLMDGLLLLFASALLMAPGFLTDIFGLALLIPAVRTPIKAYARARLERVFRGRYGI